MIFSGYGRSAVEQVEEDEEIERVEEVKLLGLAAFRLFDPSTS
jgi:hypothetical protein